MAGLTFDVERYTASFFKDGGRGELDPETGLVCFDCFGLFRDAKFQLTGILLDDRNISCHAVEQVHKAIMEQAEQPKLWLKLDEPEIGCAVVFRSCENNCASKFYDHLGIYFEEGKILHTMPKIGARVIGLHDDFWSRRIGGFYRYVGS